MASTKHAREISTAEMTRLIYQVNKRLYRLEKSGANKFNSVYENALSVIQRGEQKQNKKRLTVSKNPERLHEQYMRALEITGSGQYEELTISHIKSEIKKGMRTAKNQPRDKSKEEDKRVTAFQSKGIDSVDYAVYNLLKSREFKQLSESLGSDVVLRTIAPAVNAGLGTSQLREMIRKYLKASSDSDMYYVDELQSIVNEYAERYT